MSSLIADPVALVRAASNTTKMTKAVKDMWEVRTKTRATLNDATAMDLVIRAQIDEVFLVLAHLGEAILSLGVFNKDYYMQTLGDVQASISSCGHELLPMAWAQLDAEVQYVCTAGFAFCACYAPLSVYRGFGACVLGDWDWACPDIAYLEEKARKKAIRTIYGFKQKTDPQPTRSVFIAFDQAIQILQVKPMAFLEKRPVISGFAEYQLRPGPKPKKEGKDDIDLLEDWTKQVEKRGHPAAGSQKFTNWGIPFATWTSDFSCRVMKSHRDCETIILNQTDPGRLLHAFVCRGNANLDEGQILLLLPGSPAESLLSWLHGLPGTSHKIIRWKDLDTEQFEKKLSKSMRRKIGSFPLPTTFAVRDPNSASRPGLPASTSSPAVLEHPNTVSPPPYSPSTSEVRELRTQSAAVELPLRSPAELSSTPMEPSAQHSASLPLPGPTSNSSTTRNQHLGISSGLKSIHNLRRKPSSTPQAAVDSTSTASIITSTTAGASAEASNASTCIQELPAAELSAASIENEAPVVAELPTDFQVEAPASRASLGQAETAVPANIEGATQEQDRETGMMPTNESDEKATSVATPTHSSTETPTNDAKTNTIEEAGTHDTGVSPTTPAGPVDHMELLQKVATGEVSPLEVAEMLKTGHFGQSSTARPNVEPAQQAADRIVAGKDISSGSTPPYPVYPHEREISNAAEQQQSLP